MVEDKEDEEEDEDEEEERRQSEAKVNQWLTIPESPTTSSSLDHSQSLSHSQSSHSHSAGGRAVSGKRFGGGFSGIDEESGNGFGGEGMDMWRGAVTMEGDGEEDLLPEVERMALEAEERVRMRGGELVNGNVVEKGSRKDGSLKKAGRQLSLFGKRKGKEEVSPVVGLFSIIYLQIIDNLSLRLIHTVALAPVPQYPVTEIPHHVAPPTSQPLLPHLPRLSHPPCLSHLS